jgi:acetylornithine deacetylase/succinyl-diaminopimelate desuccinylase-like protein
MNSTTRRYLREMAKLPEFPWLSPLVPRLDNPATAQAAANQIHQHDTEFDAMLRTTVVPTMLKAGIKINVIPNTAEAQVDVRRLPSETREEIMARFRQTINDSSIELTWAPGQQMPSTEPSAMTTVLYKAMEHVIARLYPRDVVVPYMSRGATDGSYLRAHGTAVYGAPIFLRDERITPKILEDGVELLWQMVLETAGGN